MNTADGDAAVATLVARVVGELGEAPDYREVADQLNDGFALIAALYPEVYRSVVVEAVNDGIAREIAARLETL